MSDAADKKAVVIGGGFGGVTATHHLGRLGLDVTLVDRNNYHTFQPLLYQVATAGLDANDVAHSLRAQFRRYPNVDVRLATATGVDPDARQVSLDDGTTLSYDYLVVGAGGETNYFGVEGAPEHALPMKTLDQALVIRNRLLRCFEGAAEDPTRVDAGWLNVVIVGGGPTGVELAGGMAELYRVLRRDFHHVPVSRGRIILVEAAPVLLGPFSPKSQAYAKRSLVRNGVEVRVGTTVERVAPDSVTLHGGEQIGTRTVIWAGGIRAQDLADTMGLTQTHGARVEAQRDCSVKGHPEIFVIGDLGAAPDPDGRPYPQLAQPAIQQGRHAAHQIERRLRDRPTKPFHYVDKGTMATIGRNRAVAELSNGWRFQGFVAWVMWLLLHLLYLTGFRNRLSVLVNWAWGYLTYDRGARLITDRGEDAPRRA
ncbi:MAG: NAD(P)/FAD-dependent oxidoreductase [Acidimicrobiia bacterium]|nr:NAD(P)/FAD-dependent oxidoreductase [Acidimicrobiia bacterium]